ncbi:hypothetical protein [Paraburkholderia sp. HD33-4]|uniref:hypothetical protein n=1 Tax=Paraburkholderia sp. HD33-4 TaxID=2883242 RepID=UPI001F45F596|nr:hypothetical protein [Paraburkholderia sp. HD33-4]
MEKGIPAPKDGAQMSGARAVVATVSRMPWRRSDNGKNVRALPSCLPAYQVDLTLNNTFGLTSGVFLSFPPEACRIRVSGLHAAHFFNLASGASRRGMQRTEKTGATLIALSQ